MPRPASSWVGALPLVLLSTACPDTQAVLRITVEDPGHLADAATALNVGEDPAKLDAIAIPRGGFPITLTLANARAVSQALWLDAVDGDGQVLGRAHQASVRFSRESSKPVVFRLAAPCESAIDCQDGLHCNGAERCDDRMCQPGPVPCPPSAFACVQVTCVEQAMACAIDIQHDICDPIQEADGSLTPTYCDPGAGCVRGDPCDGDADCQDASICNGAERCIGGRCVAGIPIALDDGNACTVDACVEGVGAQSFNVADGNTCTLGAPDDGICLAGVCKTSICGDGYLDRSHHESCDSGTANSDTQPDACRTSCQLSACADHVTDLGEACDDGNLISGDGCRGDCGKQETCNDGELDLGEDCDDGNDNPNDGCYLCARQAWTPELLLGLGLSTGAPLEVQLYGVARIRIDRGGNLFFADRVNNRVLRQDAATGIVTSVAGVFRPGIDSGAFSGDGGPATSAELFYPSGLALDSEGNLYLADTGNHRIRKIDGATGIISTVAGSGTETGVVVDGILATACELLYPRDVQVDLAGNLYIADTGHHSIRFVDRATGVISTIAGTGWPDFNGDSGAATATHLHNPWALSLDGHGHLYIADRFNHRIRMLALAASTLSTVAGSGPAGGGQGSFEGDGGQATAAKLSEPEDVFADASGALLIVDTGNRRIRRVAASGVIQTIAGTGDDWDAGDGGQATQAALWWPRSVAVDGQGTTFIGSNHYVRAVVPGSGVIERAVGRGDPPRPMGASILTSLQYLRPGTVAASAEAVFFSWESVVYRIDLATNTVSVAAGRGGPGISGDGGPAVEAVLSAIWGLDLDALGDLYISAGSCVRKVDLGTGIIQTVAGSPSLSDSGFSGDGGPAVNARLCAVGNVSFDAQGALYIADVGNHRVRRVDRITGRISTVAGSGDGCSAGGTWGEVPGGFSGDGGPATAARLHLPLDVEATADGTLFITDTGNNRIRRVDAATGIITTVAGMGPEGSSPGLYDGDGASATSAHLNQPWAARVDAAGDLLIADTGNFCVRRVDATSGIITTLAGNGSEGFSGDGGLAPRATLSRPSDLALNATGPLYLATLDQLRAIDLTRGVITTVIGAVDPIDVGDFDRAALSAPNALAWLPGVGYLVAGGGNGRVYRADLQQRLLDVVAGYPGGFEEGEDSVATPLVQARYSRLLDEASGVVYDAVSHAVYVAERERHVIRRIDVTDLADSASWTISTWAGAEGSAGDAAGPGLTEIRFRRPAGLALDAQNRMLYIADSGNHTVRRLLLDSQRSEVVAGVSGLPGYFETPGGLATDALLRGPEALALRDSHLYVADTGSHRVRRVDLDTGAIETVIGDGTPASSGAGSPSRIFPVQAPRGVDVDSAGNLFITSTSVVRVVTAGADGVVRGDGEALTIYGLAPRDAFPMNATACLTGVHVGAADVVRVVDRCQGYLLELRRAPEIP